MVNGHPNGRCYWHGGATPYGVTSLMTNPAQKRFEYLPPELKARFEHLNGDAIEGLEESVRIQQTLESRLLEQLSTGESAQAWQLLNELVPQYEYADPQTKDGIVNRMKQIIQGGLKAYGVRKEIQNIHETERKLVETLSKVRKETQEIFTLEQRNEFVGAMLRILKEEIDTESMRRVGMRIQGLIETQQQEKPINVQVIKREQQTVSRAVEVSADTGRLRERPDGEAELTAGN